MVDSTAPTDRSNEAVIHDLGHLRVTSITVGEYENNSYLLECVATGERLLIDAAAKSAVLLELLAGGGLAQVLTTHFHTTTGALRDVVEATTATTLAPADAPGIPVPTTVQVRGGDRVRVGKITLDTLHLVEHTAGSLALAYAQPGGPYHIRTGDTLFPGGIGNTHDEPALFELLYRDVVAKVFDVYADDTTISPGHGRNESSLRC